MPKTSLLILINQQNSTNYCMSTSQCTAAVQQPHRLLYSGHMNFKSSIMGSYSIRSASASSTFLYSVFGTWYCKNPESQMWVVGNGGCFL